MDEEIIYIKTESEKELNILIDQIIEDVRKPTRWNKNILNSKNALLNNFKYWLDQVYKSQLTKILEDER